VQSITTGKPQVCRAGYHKASCSKRVPAFLS